VGRCKGVAIVAKVIWVVARWFYSSPSLFTFPKVNVSVVSSAKLDCFDGRCCVPMPGCCYVVAKVFWVVARWFSSSPSLFTFPKENVSVFRQCKTRLL